MPDQIGCQLRQSFVLAARTTVLECNILALYVAGFTQPLAESGHEMWPRSRRATAKNTDQGHRQLLRTNAGRPANCRSADERDEIPPKHADHRDFYPPALRPGVTILDERAGHGCRTLA